MERWIFSLCLVVAAAMPASASEAPLTSVDKADLISRLNPTTDGTTRSAAVAVRPGVNLAVAFERGSAELTPEALQILLVLGAAFQDEALLERRFRLIGHTDATGPSNYNARLSLERAQSVRTFLIDAFGIDAARLEVEGLGENAPLVADDPADGRNRRVEIRTIE